MELIFKEIKQLLVEKKFQYMENHDYFKDNLIAFTSEIVIPIIRSLGWDIDNPELISPLKDNKNYKPIKFSVQLKNIFFNIVIVNEKVDKNQLYTDLHASDKILHTNLEINYMTWRLNYKDSYKKLNSNIWILDLVSDSIDKISESLNWISYTNLVTENKLFFLLNNIEMSWDDYLINNSNALKFIFNSFENFLSQKKSIESFNRSDIFEMVYDRYLKTINKYSSIVLSNKNSFVSDKSNKLTIKNDILKINNTTIEPDSNQLDIEKASLIEEITQLENKSNWNEVLNKINILLNLKNLSNREKYNWIVIRDNLEKKIHKVNRLDEEKVEEEKDFVTLKNDEYLNDDHIFNKKFYNFLILEIKENNYSFIPKILKFNKKIINSFKILTNNKVIFKNKNSNKITLMGFFEIERIKTIFDEKNRNNTEFIAYLKHIKQFGPETIDFNQFKEELSNYNIVIEKIIKGYTIIPVGEHLFKNVLYRIKSASISNKNSYKGINFLAFTFWLICKYNHVSDVNSLDLTLILNEFKRNFPHLFFTLDDKEFFIRIDGKIVKLNSFYYILSPSTWGCINNSDFLDKGTCKNFQCPYNQDHTSKNSIKCKFGYGSAWFYHENKVQFSPRINEILESQILQNIKISFDMIDNWIKIDHTNITDIKSFMDITNTINIFNLNSKELFLLFKDVPEKFIISEKVSEKAFLDFYLDN